MSNIYGAIQIDFTCDRPITKETFRKFEKRMNELVNEFEDSLSDAAADLGFGIEDIHPVLLDDLVHESEDEEQ